MQAFCALIWDQSNRQQKSFIAQLCERIRRQHDGETVNFEAPGLIVYDFSAPKGQQNIHPFQDKSGVVFGPVFKKQVNQFDKNTPLTFSRRASEKISNSLGQNLIDDYWGHYIAFLRKDQATYVIADPTSAIPCFYMSQSGVTIVFSHLELCNFFDKSQFSINWKFISALLIYDKIRNGDTGLNEIHELLGGQRLAVSGDGLMMDSIWDPRKIALDVYEPNVSVAAEELRNITQHCVITWASQYKHVMLDLSGGLDSSIVLSSLSLNKESTKATPIHYTSEAGDVSEVRYARAAALHTDHYLLERNINPADTFPDVAQHPLTPRPYRNFLALNYSTMQKEKAMELGAGAFFTGEGGDHIFYYQKSGQVLADYMHHRGISFGFGKALIDAARLSETSIWRVILDALLKPAFARDDNLLASKLTMYRNMINEDIYSNIDTQYLSHAWVSDSLGLPPAKYEQIGSMLHMVHFREPFGRCEMADVIHPLMSQPLIELCLRMPTYLLTLNGIERGLARNAFKGLIPDVVRLRRTKGGTVKHHVNRLTSNLRKIGSTLLDGHLVQNGLIKRENIETFLYKDHYSIDTTGARVLTYYAIEAWLQNWMCELNSSARVA